MKASLILAMLGLMVIGAATATAFCIVLPPPARSPTEQEAVDPAASARMDNSTSVLPDNCGSGSSGSRFMDIWMTEY
jgi:hypothetical protein